MSSPSEKTEYPYGYGLGTKSLIKLYMNKANVQKWSFVLGLAPLLLMYFWTLFREHVFVNQRYEFLDSFIGSLWFLVWGFLGFFWAYRRQVPQVITVKGKPAYIMGMFMMLGSFSISAYMFVTGIRLLIQSMK